MNELLSMWRTEVINAQSKLIEELERQQINDQRMVEKYSARLEELEAEIERLREVLTAILDYPDIRDYIGTLLYDNGRDALQEQDDD